VSKVRIPFSALRVAMTVSSGIAAAVLCASEIAKVPCGPVTESMVPFTNRVPVSLVFGGVCRS
jgi:hypothetical protein